MIFRTVKPTVPFVGQTAFENINNLDVGEVVVFKKSNGKRKRRIVAVGTKFIYLLLTNPRYCQLKPKSFYFLEEMFYVLCRDKSHCFKLH